MVSIYPGFGASVFGSTGSFSDNLLPGIYDFAALAFDFPTNNVLAVKIVRSQTVPGAVNGGNPIKFLASDATTVQSISVTNDPWGGPTLEIDASFTTANRTSFPLQVAPSSASSNLYWVVPSSETQTGDYYSFGASDTNATTGQAIGTTQTATGASAITLAMPAPMASSAPVPSTFPNFTINYAGFSGQAYTASISWNASSIYYIIETVKITITATASFQNGATTLAIPDLTSLLGFFGPATSGTMVTWSTSLSSGTNSSGSSSWVQTSGTYIEP
jgi:hypothetical protein